MPLPFHEVAGQTLNPEQAAWLEGLFAGLSNRGYRFSDATPAPASSPAQPAPAAAPNLDDLTQEERIKRELHPLDAYPRLLQNAGANTAPSREDAFRFKWQGLFFMGPLNDGYMARLRIPGGRLSSTQLRSLADIADQLTTGYIQVTTRANLQLRHITPANAPEFLRRIQAIGLHTRGAGADNIRNLTCDPTSGIDPDEHIETLPIVEQLGHLIINQREFYDLPRKFNIAFHGGGLIPTVEDTNDIGWKAVRVWDPAAAADAPAGTLRPGDLVTPQVAPGIYFRCALGGATGHKAFARDLGVLVPPRDILNVTAALLRVFIQNGNRSDRKKARLKHLLEKWSLDQYRAETEKCLGFELLRIPASATTIPAATPAAATPLHPHLGVHPQRQPGLRWIGVSVPVGQVTSAQLRQLATLAETHASGEVRLTVWQNLIIPNVPEAAVEPLQHALREAGLPCHSSALRGGFVACTGNAHCRFAQSDTKAHALELMEWLDTRVTPDQPVNIHLTGCPNSCAQHYMGDIGLLGVKTRVEGASVEAYHVFVGGGFGDRQAVGRQLFTAIPFPALRPLLEKMLRAWLELRAPAESFQQFTARHDAARLQELFKP